MKKGLSVLLIAAALFGFYGGATNLNDVLACKDYWEDAGAKSTADMNKLEDGLNQLKDNEQAYLDGKIALAEGEQTLADGEAQYADGLAQYAQGLADYAAAPGELAAARKQIAEGEAALEEGKKTLDEGYADYDAAPSKLKDLNKLIKGLEKAKKGYLNEWSPGYEKKGTKAKQYTDGGLRASRKLITDTLNTDENKASVKLIEGLSETSGLLDGVSSKKDYASYDKGIQKLSKAFEKAADSLTELNTTVKQYAEDTEDTTALKEGLRKETSVPTAYDKEGNPTAVKALNEMTLKETENALASLNKVISAGETSLSQAKAGKSNLEGAKAKMSLPGETPISALGDSASDLIKMGLPGTTTIDQAIAFLDNKISEGSTSLTTAKASAALLTQLVDGRKTAQQTIAGVKKQAGDKLAMAGSLDKRLASLNDAIEVLDGDPDVPNGTYADTYEQLQAGLKVLATVLDEKIKDINGNKEKFDAWHDGYEQLKDGKDDLASTSSGIPYAFSNMLSNDTIRAALDKNAKSLIPLLKEYTGTTLDKEDLPAFNSDMKVIAKKIIPKALTVLYDVKKDAVQAYKDAPAQLAKGEKDYAAGKKALANGKKQYAQGLADYKAAPGKLADARAQLADAEQQLADGRKQLEEGREQLAVYEDGEQQVRDGLATLTGTKADLGLTSILDRLGGDDDFDNGDDHLEIDEGLAAVEAGRGYQAEDGDLITEEITARAVGTAGLLGAGVLAVLAAILSFLKKNKGAGVFAILAAAAGAFGAAYGTNAGTYFSEIAGSTAGNAGWVAAGILAAVAAVHAIVHFAAKKAA